MPSNHPCFSFSSFSCFSSFCFSLLSISSQRLLIAWSNSNHWSCRNFIWGITCSQKMPSQLLVLCNGGDKILLYFRNQWESVGGAEDRLRSFNRPRSIAVKPSDSNQVINPVRKPQKMSFGQMCDSLANFTWRHFPFLANRCKPFLMLWVQTIHTFNHIF